MDGRLPRPLEMDPNRFNQRLYRWMDNDAPWSVIPQNKGRPHMSGSGSQPQDPGYSYGYRESAPSEADTIPQGGVPPPSDSGYATQPHLDSVSLYSQPLDRSQDIQSLVGQMNDLGGFNIVQGVGSGLPQYSIGPHHNSENKGSFFCNFPGCKKPVCKTRSELNKHSARHNKPHKCDVPGCNRTEGFSTPNDLARHKQSVHNNDGVKYVCSEGQCQSKMKLWPRADNFRAHLDRMHRIKVAADDLAPYLYKEPLSLSSENMMHLSGLGATYDPSTLPNRFPDMSPISPDKSQDDGNNLDLGTDTHYSNYDMSVLGGPGGDVYGPSGTTGLDNMPSNASQDSPAQQLPEFVRPNMLSSPMIIDSSAHPSPARTSEHRLPQKQPSTEAIDLTSDDPMQDDSSDVPSTTMMEEDRSSPTSSDCESPAHRGSSIKEPRGILASFMDDDLESADLSEDHAVKLVKKLEESGILEKLGYKQTKQASPITEPKPTVKRSTSNNSSEAQSSFSCPDPGCTKTFSRNCELKKHMKRHEKPYGCTFGNCRKVFGSKNDWKRHENSQHFQLEVWKCDCRPSPSAEPCGKVSHRRETFRSHLQRDHSLQDPEIEKRLDSCRIGRNCEGAFWCGFCRKRVPLTKKGQMGWNERFDHIDAHFFGRTPNNKKMDISEWEAIDPDQKSLDEDGGESDSDTSVLPGSRRKRGHADEPEAEELERQKRPRRHPRGQLVTLVTCCHCRSMQTNLSLAKSCVNDDHRFCDNCPRETALSNEDMEAERL